MTQDIQKLIDAQDWQDIASAPKDKQVWLRVINSKHTHIEHIIPACYVTEDDCGWLWDGDEVMPRFIPTHWKPINNTLADALRIAVEALDEASQQVESTGVIGNDEVPTGIAETAQEALSEIKAKLEGD